MAKSFQDQLHGNHCFGCGALNKDGLQIKSYWVGDWTAECIFQPQSWHCAGPKKFMNGGVIATVIDCHCICTAMAYAAREQGIELGSEDMSWYATGKLALVYSRPVAITESIQVIADINNREGKRIWLDARLWAGERCCVEATVEAVRVPPQWMI